MSVDISYSGRHVRKRFVQSRGLWPLPRWLRTKHVKRPLAQTTPARQAIEEAVQGGDRPHLRVVCLECGFVAGQRLESFPLLKAAIHWALQSPTRIFYVFAWRTLNGTVLRAGRFEYDRVPMHDNDAAQQYMQAVTSVWLQMQETSEPFRRIQPECSDYAIGFLSALQSASRFYTASAIAHSLGSVLTSWLQLCGIDVPSVLPLFPETSVHGHAVRHLYRQTRQAVEKARRVQRLPDHGDDRADDAGRSKRRKSDRADAVAITPHLKSHIRV
ncbi:hypothetical protein THASP1DRAFT_33781 [Thamnocephalis sphaerospora]|uniref:Uncharacterized protein n=1 Tax=Thamnocephalis sphaerospora TaxID=78915 RepID=A0A4P9XGZ1_9FUNG|nr:hypothetical protein THASP1DRAFT_33781 [Thamnocephalis sphaerospora]|eukprot:RKP04450.1 hypothetical protein THASP1DRAFT_33781 [Thamnocephalis sphaerospora]